MFSCMTKLALFLTPRVLYFHTNKTMYHQVFVYGTLKRNEPNHFWLTNKENGKGEFVDSGRTKNKYPLVIATKYNIPFMLYNPGLGHQVKGEIYKVDDLMLSNLDSLEDHPNIYIREQVDILSETTNELVKCWVYFIKNFKPALMSLPQLECYSSSGSHGLKYLESPDDEASQEDLRDVLDK